MSNGNNESPNNNVYQQPRRPIVRGVGRYDVLREAEVAVANRIKASSMPASAAGNKRVTQRKPEHHSTARSLSKTAVIDRDVPAGIDDGNRRKKEDNSSNQNVLFNINLTATSNQGGSMDQSQNGEQFLIDLVFKPNKKELRLRPEETQLLLAHVGEILKEVEEEEKSTSAPTNLRS